MAHVEQYTERGHLLHDVFDVVVLFALALTTWFTIQELGEISLAWAYLVDTFIHAILAVLAVLRLKRRWSVHHYHEN